ncbi:flavodoxin family protein [Cryptosporangium sp. NPDC051539]|uniref:flavodoxin family protein n=1 Tax=Cryptosporangium sp. NPDC051539 TaxID=3363962 RepID=UPI00378ABB22
MRTLIVVESLFGNTRQIADAVEAGLADAGPVTVAGIDEAPAELPDDVDLLVVGGPTHAFGLSRPGTRKTAADQGARDVGARGVREWLVALPSAAGNVATAAFSTRLKKRFVPGSAARAIDRRLRGSGYLPVVPPEDFWVLDTRGPLRARELDRARLWGTRLARAVEHRGERSAP